VFTCPPYNSVGSVKITELERLKRTPSPPKASLFQGNKSIQKSEKLSTTKGTTNLPSRRNENVEYFRRDSIKERIRFYDGGSDLPNPSSLKPGPKLANMRSISSYHALDIPIAPSSVKVDNPRSSSKALAARKGNSGSSWKIDNQPPSTRPDAQPRFNKQNAVSYRPLQTPSRAPFTASTSLVFKTPGSTEKSQTTGQGSAQKSDFSPLRERRLTRSSIPRKSPGSLPQSAQIGSSLLLRSTEGGGRSRSHLPQPSIERKQPPLEWKQVGEKVSELYRAKSHEITSLYPNQQIQRLRKVSPMKNSIDSAVRNMQVDGPGISRKLSKIASLRALFDAKTPKEMAVLDQPSEPFELVDATLLGIRKYVEEDLSHCLPLRHPLGPIETELSVILERREQSSSMSMIKDTQALQQENDVQEATKYETGTLSLPVQEYLQQNLHNLPFSRIDDRKSPREENRPISLLTPSLSAQKLLLPSIEIHNPAREIFPNKSVTPDLPVIPIEKAIDPDRTLTPLLPEGARLWVPKKRKTKASNSGKQVSAPPYVPTILSPLTEIKPLRILRERQSLIPQATKLAAHDLSRSSSPQRRQIKSKAIQERLKIFERRVPETLVKSDPSLRKGDLKNSTSPGQNLRLKRKSKGVEKPNPDISIRRVLSVDTINAIIVSFRAMEAATISVERGTETTKAKLEPPKDAIEKIEPVQWREPELAGASGSKSRLDMVIKEVDCEMVSPKPVRLTEMNRIMVLCGGKADKNSRYQKHQ